MKCVFDDQTKNISSVLDAVWPVGSIYISVDATNPGEKLGGTWEVFAQGQMLLGFSDTHDIGSTGGEETHTLTTDEMPSHAHSIGLDGNHRHQMWRDSNHEFYDNTKITPEYKTTKHFQFASTSGNGWPCGYTQYAGSHSHSMTNTGGGAAHNNMPPYITVGIWRRIA